MENILSELLNSFTTLSEKEDLEKYKGLVDTIEVPTNSGLFDFDRSFLRPLRKFAEVLIKVKISDNPDVVEIIMNHQYYVQHFEHWIKRIEGNSCCHDKSTTLVDMLIAYYRKNEPMVFDYESKRSFCYPKTIFNTQEKVVEFYKSLKQLRYGNCNSYMLQLHILLRLG